MNLPILLCDLAGNSSYVWELVILILILIAILAILFLNEDDDSEAIPVTESAAQPVVDTEALSLDRSDESAPSEPEKESMEAEETPEDQGGLNALSKARTDEKLGLVFDSAPEDVDDLTQISGVGNVLQDKLNDFGVYRFEQIAAWDATLIAEFSKRLTFKGRVERENWVSQAQDLAKKRDA